MQCVVYIVLLSLCLDRTRGAHSACQIDCVEQEEAIQPCGDRGVDQVMYKVHTQVEMTDFDQSTLAVKAGGKPIELDMAKNSAAYIFTQTQVNDEVAIGYIRKEWAKRRDFLQVWDEANRTLGQTPDVPRGLRREHVIAIRAYTADSSLHSEFNAATRQYGANDASYQKKFHFKSFHYLLSVALDKLKKTRLTTYRGSQELFNATMGERVRFGHFASSTSEKIIAKRFMKVSNENALFKIVTKLGVTISQFSKLPHESEILIPLIEVFKVKHKPDWVKENNLRWRKISLTANGCQGVTVTVQTRNGALEVKRGKGKCPKDCQCIQG